MAKTSETQEFSETNATSDEKKQESSLKGLTEISSVNISKPSQPFTNKKVRGRVVDGKGNRNISNKQVIFYASALSASANQHQKVIAVCKTDRDGNFSFPFPLGEFKVATAVVSILPTEIQVIELSEKHEFQDFIWIVLETLPESLSKDDHDDCECKGDKTPFLPDMEELIENSAYAQDIGGSCMNFTTPNRTLEEFNYLMVVRTSDPELFGYSLDKIKDRIKYINDRIASIQKQIHPFTVELTTQLDFNKLPMKDLESTQRINFEKIEEVLTEVKNINR